MLFRAIAERKLYRIENNYTALVEIKHILSVIAPLHKDPPSGARDDDVKKANRLEFKKIHISVLAEKAYVLGAYLILLKRKNYVTDGLGKIAKVEKAIEEKMKDADNDPTLKALGPFRSEMEQIHRRHLEIVKDAQDLINGIESDDDKWKSAKPRILSDLANAAAYAQFRHAQAVVDDDKSFREECERALKKLSEAHAAHPSEQTILLNMGLIQGDPRCDPEGQSIEVARNYLKQASALKPTDYYAPQLLATLGVREIYTWGPFAKAETLKEAIEAGEKARTLRLEDGTIPAVLAQAYVLQWASLAAAATADDRRKEVVAKIEAAIALAQAREATPVHLRTVQLQWLVARTAKSTDDELSKEGGLAKELVKAIDAAIEVARANPGWYGRQLQKDATSLRTKAETLKPGEQSSLQWPN